MGLFDMFKSKRTPMNQLLEFKEQLSNSIFPKGEKDIAAGTNELLHILNNKIDYDTAKNIFLKSIVISRISENFDKDRLITHFQGYCIEYFENSQIDQYYGYLIALKAAMICRRRTPSEVRRDGANYVW